jgi:hypothetical protein
MPRPKGIPKTGGRRKGTANKKSLFLKKALDEANFSVVTELISLLPNLRGDKRADILFKMLEYLYPKRRAIDLETNIESSNEPKISITIPSNGREST